MNVIELRRDVVEKKRFAAANPDRRNDKPCVYVGQTALAPEERFAQHLAGHKCCPLVRDYGECLQPRLYANFGPFDRREDAEKAEAALAARLRRTGYAVRSH